MGLATYVSPPQPAQVPHAANNSTVCTNAPGENPWRRLQKKRKESAKEVSERPWRKDLEKTKAAHTANIAEYDKCLLGGPRPIPEADPLREDTTAAKAPYSESAKCMKRARQTSSAESKMGTYEQKGSSSLGKEQNEVRNPTSGRRTTTDHEANNEEGNDRGRTAAGRSDTQKADETRSSKEGSSRKDRKGRDKTIHQPEAGRDTEYRQSTRSEKRTDRRRPAFAESTR